jgi:hypothetical protein
MLLMEKECGNCVTSGYLKSDIEPLLVKEIYYTTHSYYGYDDSFITSSCDELYFYFGHCYPFIYQPDYQL